jgi:methylenetetrahydrofolate reductase (NADPH)
MDADIRLADIYRTARRPVISFELFPPKTNAGLARLLRLLPGLAALRPDFFTVTYGAFGSARGYTLEIASHVLYRYRLPTACHLTCVGASRARLDAILEGYCAAGIRNVVALRGDPPQGSRTFVAALDGYAHADELVRHIHEFTARTERDHFGLAVAGYPEVHPEAPELDADLANLKRKVDAGADAVITQLFFDNACYFRFVEAARARGLAVPIVPGLMPILSAAQIRRVTAKCGARIPRALQSELEAAGDDEARAQEVGVRQCLAQVTDLLRRGAPGVHFYILNQFDSMRRILERLGR